MLQNQRQTPRELSSQFGYESLTDEQLLALVLRIGTKHSSVYSIAKKYAPIMDTELNQNTATNDFSSQVILPTQQKYVFLALYELLLRQKRRTAAVVTYTKPLQLAELFHFLCAKKQEYVYGVYLSPRFAIVRKQLLTKGTTDSVIIDPRDVLYYGIKHRVRQMIVIHNHPSGSPEPSTADIEQTKKLSRAAKQLDMLLVDHIIIAKEGYFSFKESTSVL